MKKIVALALAAASLIALPVITPSLAVDTSISALCGPDGPESYKRPGGYCDQVGSNKSLVEGQDCSYYYVPSSGEDVRTFDDVQLVADTCYDYEVPILH